MDRHSRWRRLVAAYAGLEAEQRTEVDGHLRTCMECQELLASYQHQDMILRSLPVPAPHRTGTREIYRRADKTQGGAGRRGLWPSWRPQSWIGAAMLAASAVVITLASLAHAGRLSGLVGLGSPPGRSGSWHAVAPLPAPRSRLAAVTGLDGHIYVIGGRDGSGSPMERVDAYDPATNRWTRLAPMLTWHDQPAVTMGKDDRIYVISGYSSRGTILNTVDTYDPRTNRWSTVAPIPTARGGAAATTGTDGRIYVIGGHGLAHTCIPDGNCATAEAYDPRTNSWKSLPEMPIPREWLGAVTGPDGLIYAIGGHQTTGYETGFDVENVEVYDPRTNRWNEMTGMPTTRTWFAAATGMDGRIYVIGGGISDLPAPNSSHRIDVYDPRTNRWSLAAPMPTARTELAATTGTDGRIYAIGGVIGREIGPPVTTNRVEVYTP